MKVVTLDMVTSLDRCYINVKFPVFILHSTEELKSFVEDVKKPARVVKNTSELITFIGEKTGGLKEGSDTTQIVNTQEDNVWLATNEIYKPDKFINGVILYQTENGEPIKTDNCYIQLLSFKVYPSGIIAATSSGLYLLRFWGGWVTAALKPNFSKTSSTGKTPAGTAAIQKAKHMKLLKRKRLTAGDVRFIFYTVLPSMQFKDVYAAAHKAYGTTYPKKIIDKLLETERIQQGIIKEIAKMIPNFEEILLKVYSQEEIATDIKTMVKKTLERNSNEYDVEATRKALSVVFKVLDQPTTISPYQSSPLIAGALPNMITSSQASQLQKTLEVNAPSDISDEDIKEFEKDMGAPLTGTSKSTKVNNNNNNQQIVDIQ